MKVLTASLCALAALCLTVRGAPEEQQQQQQQQQQQLQQEPQTYFGLALQRDDAQGIVSEYEFRGAILAQSAFFDQPMSAEAVTRPTMSQPTIFDKPNCTNYEEILKAALPTIPDQLTKLVSRLKASDVLKQAVVDAVTTLAGSISADGADTLSIAFAEGVSLALEALKLAFTALDASSGVVQGLLTVLTELQEFCKMPLICSLPGADTTLPQNKQVTCNSVADVYRLMVKKSIETIPAIEDAAADDMKRAASGSASVLDLMDKSSIASTNENLLAVRPIFAGNLLDQYRQELLHLSSNEDVKAYAEANLGLVINMSNALEACLRVAADPASAAEEFAEESDFLADEDEEWEEDEDDE